METYVQLFIAREALTEQARGRKKFNHVHAMSSVTNDARCERNLQRK